MSNTMPYQQRKDILRALKAARPLIWDGTLPRGNDGKMMYICDAIWRAHNNGAISDRAQLVAKRLIADRIGRHQFSLYGWLEMDAGIPRHEITPARLQAHRIAWVDHLIAEFSDPSQ